jgi:hypothetical protein
MTEYLFRFTYEDLDNNDCYDIEASVSCDNYYDAWSSATRRAFDHIKIRSNDGYSIELTRIEVVSMFNPKI